MIDALTGSTLWLSLGAFALAAWAASRAVVRWTGERDATAAVVGVTVAVALTFAVSFVLMARFRPWTVLLALSGAGAVAVIAGTIASGRAHHPSGQGMAGLGLFIAAIWAVVLVPLALAVPIALAWLVHRLPPARLGWGLLFAALALAGALSSGR